MKLDINKILGDLSLNTKNIKSDNFDSNEDVSLFDGLNNSESESRIDSLTNERASLVSALSSTTDENQARELQNRIDRIDDEIHQEKLHERYEKFVSESNLPKDISRQLYNLTVESIETDDLAGRAAREQAINAIKSQYSLSESDLEHLDLARSIAQEYKINQLEKQQARSDFASNEKIASLEKQLEHTSNSGLRTKIQNDIEIAKEEQFKNNMQFEKNKFLTSTNLPLNAAYQLFDLYAQKGEITDAAQLAEINGKIEQISQEYNLSSSDIGFLTNAENLSKEHKLNKLESQHDSLSDANLMRLEDLFNQIANTTDQNEISRLYAEIDALGSEQFRATSDFEKESFLTTTDLPKDVAAQLYDLTMEITLSDDDNQIQMLNEQLNTLTQQFSLSDSDTEALAEAKNLSKQYKLDVFTSQYVQVYRANVNEFQRLHNELENATDSATKEKIQSEIQAVTNKMRSETLKFEEEKFLLDTELPRNVARELFQLTVEKTQTTDETQLANINANISTLSKEYNISEADLAHLADAEEVAAAE